MAGQKSLKKFVARNFGVLFLVPLLAVIVVSKPCSMSLQTSAALSASARLSCLRFVRVRIISLRYDAGLIQTERTRPLLASSRVQFALRRAYSFVCLVCSLIIRRIHDQTSFDTVYPNNKIYKPASEQCPVRCQVAWPAHCTCRPGSILCMRLESLNGTATSSSIRMPLSMW